MRVLAVCHDAGGAEIVSSWLRREGVAADAVLDGPARAVFARKPGCVAAVLPPWPPLAAYDLVVCGSSGAATLERDAVRRARAAGVRCAVWLDHWVGYAGRLTGPDGLVLPDEVWAADPHAEHLARRELPGADVRLRGNPYLDDAVAEIGELTGPEPPPAGRVLYLTEPTSVAAAHATGDPLGWGYEERSALAAFLAHLVRSGGATAVRVRTHPAEPPGRYADILASFERRLPLRPPGASLAEDVAWAGLVAGCETMALVVALAAGRRVVSAVPRSAARPLTLPFPGIGRIPDDVPQAG